MALVVLRCVFLMVAVGLGTALVRSPMTQDLPSWALWLIFLGVLALAVGILAIDIVLPQKRIDTISSFYFGLIIGLFLTYVVGLALEPLLTTNNLPGNPDAETLRFARGVIQLLVGMVLCYLCISVLLQTKDDFRFIIPYVEFSKEVKGPRPYVLDTSVVIDGRIADVVETQVLDGQLVLPRFALNELQAIADSSDRLRRSRGRRGLDILNRLRTSEKVDLKIYDRELPGMAGESVDTKLVLLTKHLEGKLVTGDYNLNKVARLHNVTVINLNDVANALKPVCLPGEQLTVQVVKPGEEDGQGVGYLDDGTMVVVEGGRAHLNQQVQLVVTSVLQTSAGRMIFGRVGSRA